MQDVPILAAAPRTPLDVAVDEIYNNHHPVRCQAAIAAMNELNLTTADSLAIAAMMIASAMHGCDERLKAKALGATMQMAMNMMQQQDAPAG